MSDGEDLPLARASTVVELIGPYAVAREIGGGGTGHVYACKDLGLNRDVAIKILDEEFLADDIAVQRFEREGQLLAKIDSPHIAHVFQVGVHGKLPYIVMELLEGRDAEGLLRDEGKLPLSQALKIARDIALALAASHAAGVVHRDVKPSNIIVTAGGAKLMDFGLAAPISGSARLTGANEIPGTAAYLAPERVGGANDPRGDIYSLGCTLYALITGHPPFEGAVPIEVIAAHLKEPAPRLVSRADVADLVASMLEKSPEQRPQTADDVARRLQAILMNEVLPASVPLPALASPTPAQHAPPEPPSAAASSTETQPQPANAAGATGVAGSLSRMGLADLLQSLEQRAATALISLRANDGATGSIGVQTGRLVHASTGAAEGADAFFTLMRWRQGSFQVQYERAAPTTNLDAAPQALMLEAFRRIDESAQGDSSSALPLESAVLVAPADAAPEPSPAPPPPAKIGASPAAHALRKHGSALTDSILVRGRALRDVVRSRWASFSPKERAFAAGAGGVIVIGLFAIVFVLAGGSPAGDLKDAKERIAKGEARAVLAELDKQDARPVDELIRAHALAATDDDAAALRAYKKAAAEGAVDLDALDYVLASINKQDAGEGIDVLASWPGKEVTSRLEGLVVKGEWWERHNALIALDKRGEDKHVDVTALGIKDLQEGSSCKQRKHGLNVLRERGRGQDALRAIDGAQRRRGNDCMWFTDYENARKAVRARR